MKFAYRVLTDELGVPDADESIMLCELDEI